MRFQTFSLVNLAKTGRKLSQEQIAEITKELTLEQIRKAVCERLQVPEIAFYSTTRLRNIVRARQVFCYLAVRLTTLSTIKIGAFIDKDHSTVLHSSNVIKNLVKFNTRLKISIIVPELYLKLNKESKLLKTRHLNETKNFG